MAGRQFESVFGALTLIDFEMRKRGGAMNIKSERLPKPVQSNGHYFILRTHLLMLWSVYPIRALSCPDDEWQYSLRRRLKQVVVSKNHDESDCR